ncbi:MAG: RNA polymerase sigma factor RpoH [Desulfuromonadales bacterium]|jgi:RNA polymerase sigma-32 factor|nr:RNA polymerase sigma factor RpoH [Desulfuromonadales bacterium]
MTTNMPVLTDNLDRYLAEIRKFPVLSVEEEKSFATRFFESKDVDAAHKLITSNLRFVVKVSSEYKAYGMRMLDLIQEGNIGLMMAVKKFNPYKGIRLISYAVWWIRAYIQNFIVSNWSLLKIGTTQAQKKLFFKLNKTKNAIKNMLGSDDLREAAVALDVKYSEAMEMDQRMKGEYSLDTPIDNENGIGMLDALPDDRKNQEELISEQQETMLMQTNIEKAVEKLNEKEQYIIKHRVSSEEPKTLQEIADHFLISRERVRQIEEGALKKLRNFLAPVILETNPT